MLSIYRPQQLLDRFFGDEFFNDVADGRFQLRADIIEKDDHFELHADMPGMEEKQIKVEVEGGFLTITGERQNLRESHKSDEVIRCERYFGKFQRSFRLGESVEQDKINGKFKNGILTLIIPKSEKTRVKKKLISLS